MNFVVEILIYLFCYLKKDFIHMNAWRAVKDLMKSYYPTKKDFYSNLNMEDITDVDYRHAKRVFKNFNHKNFGDYYDLYV